MSLDAHGHEGRTWYGPGGARPYQPDHVFADPLTASTARWVMIDSYPATTLALSDHAPVIVAFGLALGVTTERRGLLGSASSGAQ